MAVAVAVVVVMLLREPTLLQVGDVSPEKAWKEPVNLTAWGGGSLPPPCPMHASRTHFNPPACTHATLTIPISLSFTARYIPRIPFPALVSLPQHEATVCTWARRVSGHSRSWCVFTAWCRHRSWEDLDGDDIPGPPQDSD